MNTGNYILITAARNEEDFIQKTIESVINQTVLPKTWLIVSDRSTDSTEEIVKQYEPKWPFIQLLCLKGDAERNFGSKAKIIKMGCSTLADLDYDFIGNLDADVSFDPPYYEAILAKFSNNDHLGIAGAVRYDFHAGKFKKVKGAKNSVGGPTQFFRRACFEDIGGYLPLKYGGIDAVAEISARMMGWQVRTFSDIEFLHHRETGSANSSYFQTRLRYGKKFYMIGYHPAFFSLMIFKRMLRGGSFLYGGPIELLGYLVAAFRREKRPVEKDFVRYLRAEQASRLRTIIFTGKDPANIDTAVV